MEFITDLLYWISTGLLVPVVVFLLFFFLKSLIMIGGFYGQYISRTKINVRLNRRITEMNPEDFIVSVEKDDRTPLISALERIRQNRYNRVMIDKILGDYEILSDKSLGQSRLLVKIGPMLGLMGTLIPMGPALVGLATGDVASMADNMQVAFATTVVGIIIGAIGFITLQVKQRWFADDMNILEYAAGSLSAKPSIGKEV